MTLRVNFARVEVVPGLIGLQNVAAIDDDPNTSF
jgi:hypothetical protein